MRLWKVLLKLIAQVVTDSLSLNFFVCVRVCVISCHRNTWTGFAIRYIHITYIIYINGWLRKIYTHILLRQYNRSIAAESTSIFIKFYKILYYIIKIYIRSIYGYIFSRICFVVQNKKYNGHHGKQSPLPPPHYATDTHTPIK